MAELAWKAPAGTPEHEASDEAMEESVLQRWIERPNGRMELLELPLTRELFLDPQLGDKILQGDWHDITAREITDLLENYFRPQADVRVFHDMKHFLVPRRPAPGPDVSVVRGLRPRRRRSSFRVQREGVRPCLLIEVVSSSSAEARRTDLEDKVELYRLAGIPEYLIADSPSNVTGMPFKLLGYRLDAAGRYQPMKPDAAGRFLSETTGIWFQVSPDGQRIFLYEYPTGRRLLNLAEEAELRKAADERARVAEATALREAEARKKAEQRAASVEAEIANLRAELERLRGS